MNKLFFTHIRMLVLSLLLTGLPDSVANAKGDKENPIKTINMLSWWGYLDQPNIIGLAEKKCGVKISFDEYYTNDEFVRRWSGKEELYDIIIFSDTIYHVVKNKIPHFSNSSLWEQSMNYHPIIRAHYNKAKYPKNIIYVTHSVTGFLWNPNNITLSPNDSLMSIFKKAKGKYSIIVDDSIEVKKLIEASFSDEKKSELSGDILSVQNFKKLTQETNVYISNHYGEIYKKKKFAISYSWSGESIFNIVKSNNNYKFLVHPKSAKVSSDLIAQTTNNKYSLCVARFLTDKKTIASFQDNYYFSPYADYTSVENKLFKEIYRDFVKYLPIMSWGNSVSKGEFKKINQSWQLIKLSVNNH